MKVILNKCYGGFGCSDAECVEELGEKANGKYSRLEVVEIPDGLDYVIDDYDGIETLHENVRCW